MLNILNAQYIMYQLLFKNLIVTQVCILSKVYMYVEQNIIDYHRIYGDMHHNYNSKTCHTFSQADRVDFLIYGFNCNDLDMYQIKI